MKPLHGLHVVVTRPEAQAGRFCELLEQAGAIAHRYPVMAIKAAPLAPANLQRLHQTAYYQWAIFISANAVEHGLALLGNTAAFSHTRIGAIGKQTAATLQSHGIKADLVPKAGFTSEDFLALPAMQALAGQRILIVRGGDGREVLADTLRQRGANVDYADVYWRICPPNPPQRLKQLHDSGQLDIISLTSSESLHNLLGLLHPSDWVKAIPLLVGSGRIAADATQAGFTNTIIVAPNPADDSMLTALREWRQDKET